MGTDSGQMTGGTEELENFIKIHNTANNDECHKLFFPDSKDDKRTIVEINLDLPGVFKTPQTSKVRLLEKKKFLHIVQSKEIEDGKWTQDKVIDSFIKAVMNNKTSDIRTMLDQSGKYIVFDTLLKFKQKVNLKDDKERATSVSELEIFVDIFQFVVMQDKPEILKIMLEEVGARSQRELCDLLKTSLIRLNSIESLDNRNFEYEDVKLEKQSILHLAANGYNGCLKILLDKFASSDMSIPEDWKKRTLMHIAASNSSMECLDTIYDFVRDKKAILRKDSIGYTPLHYAVKYGKLETAIFILSKLLNIDNADGIDTKNNNGKTALFYAQNSQMMYLLLHYGADPCIISSPTSKHNSESVLQRYVRTNPDNAIALMNYDVETNACDIADKDMVYTYNLRLFKTKNMGALNGELNYEEEKAEKLVETDVIAKMFEAQEGSLELLNAPIAEFYFRLKWSMIKKFYFLNIAIYLVYLSSLTFFICSTSYKKNHQPIANRSRLLSCNAGFHYANAAVVNSWWEFLHISTSLVTIILILKELKILYLKQNSKLQIGFRLSILGLSLIYLTLVSFTGHYYICEWEQILGSMALLFAWIDMTLVLGSIPKFRIYITLCKNLLQQLGSVFFFYSFTIFAFACAYSVLLPKSKIFENLLTSSTKIIAMMIGEFDLESNFIMDSKNHSQQVDSPSKVFSLLLFIAVMFVVTITLANLIIGLAVDDISEKARKAKNNMPTETIQLIRKLEALLQYKGFCMIYKLLLWFVELFHLLSRINHHVLTPKDILNCKHGFLLCVKPSSSIPDSSRVLCSYIHVYFYDVEYKRSKEKLNMNIPVWIVKNTEKALVERKQIFDDLREAVDKFRKAKICRMQASSSC